MSGALGRTGRGNASPSLFPERRSFVQPSPCYDFSCVPVCEKSAWDFSHHICINKYLTFLINKYFKPIFRGVQVSKLFEILGEIAQVSWFSLERWKTRESSAAHDLYANSTNIHWSSEHIESKIVSLPTKAGYHGWDNSAQLR